MPHHVWMVSEKVWAELVRRGAYVSLVRYTQDGIEYNVFVENENFIERDVED